MVEKTQTMDQTYFLFGKWIYLTEFSKLGANDSQLKFGGNSELTEFAPSPFDCANNMRNEGTYSPTLRRLF